MKNVSIIPPKFVTSNDRLLRENELANRWGISIKKLQADRLYGRGCAFVKIGRSVRYRLDDVCAYEIANLHVSTSEVSE